LSEFSKVTVNQLLPSAMFDNAGNKLPPNKPSPSINNSCSCQSRSRC